MRYITYVLKCLKFEGLKYQELTMMCTTILLVPNVRESKQCNQFRKQLGSYL